MLLPDMTVLLQHKTPQGSIWVSRPQANMQTAANETENKSQTLNTQSSSLKVLRLIFDLEAFIDVNYVKFAYSEVIEDRIYIRFVETHVCGQV